MTRKPRFPLALCAALVLLTVAALAFAPSLRELIAASLGPKAPCTVEALGSCEDQGITIEVRSALTDGQAARLYFTVCDPSGVFFLEDTANDLYMDFIFPHQPGWGTGGKDLQQLSYDAETQTALYVYHQGADRQSTTDQTVPTHATLSMSRFTPGLRYACVTLFGPANESCILPLDRLECTWEEGSVVLLPDLNPQSLNADEVAISSMGFGDDGYYHIRFTQEAQVVPIYGQCPFDVHYRMINPEGPQGSFDDFTVSGREYGAVPVPGGWDLCLNSLTEERQDLLQLLTIEATYSVSGGTVEGMWALTVPVEQVETMSLNGNEIPFSAQLSTEP